MLYATAYNIISWKILLLQVTLFYCAHGQLSQFYDLHSSSAHLSDYVGFGLEACVHILSRDLSFLCVCLDGKGGGLECRRKVLDAICSKMSVSTSVMLECAQSVPVWDRWLALLPKVLLLFCILYLLLIRQTACTVCILFCFFMRRCGRVHVKFRHMHACDCAYRTVSSSSSLCVCVFVCGNAVMHKFGLCIGAQGFAACWVGKWRVESAVV